MFRIAQSEYFWNEVRVEVLTEDGRTVEGKFKAKFRRPSDTAFKEMLETYQRDHATDRDHVRNVLVDWQGVTLEATGNQETPFSEDALEAALEYGFGPAIMVAFVNGRPKAKAKN